MCFESIWWGQFHPLGMGWSVGGYDYPFLHNYESMDSIHLGENNLQHTKCFSA